MAVDRGCIAGLLLAALVVVARTVVLPGDNGRSLVGSVRARTSPASRSSRAGPRPACSGSSIGSSGTSSPGERLLYEEGGFDLPGVPDPFQRGRFSGLLPERTGVEVIGGPYLHAALTTNFTQFGEGQLFGSDELGPRPFRAVRPALSARRDPLLEPAARRFCRSNPDLVQVRDDDGTVLIGRVLGFEGDAIEGSARVTAEPGRLRVREMSPGVDGSVLLRYHSVPSLRARPAVPLEHRFEEGDPVPFIRLRPPPGVSEVELEMVGPLSVPRPRGWGQGSRG